MKKLKRVDVNVIGISAAVGILIMLISLVYNKQFLSYDPKDEIEFAKDGKYLKSRNSLDYNYNVNIDVDTINVIDIKNGYIFYQTKFDRTMMHIMDEPYYSVMDESNLIKYIISEVVE